MALPIGSPAGGVGDADASTSGPYRAASFLEGIAARDIGPSPIGGGVPVALVSGGWLCLGAYESAWLGGR